MDIQLNDDLTIAIDNGDFVIEENSDPRHQELIILSNKGEWRENPLVGVGIIRYLGEEQVKGLEGTIRTQLEADGYTVDKLTLSGNTIVELKAVRNGTDSAGNI